MSLPLPDHRAALAHLGRDPALAALIDQYGDLPVLAPVADPFARLIRSVVGQQLSVKAARSIYARLEERLGVVDAAGLLATSPDDLRALGLSWAKVASVQDIARAAAEGQVDFAGLAGHTDEQLLAELLPLRGVGRWTAEMFMMFALAHPDVFSFGDLALRKGLQRHYPGQDHAVVVQGWSPYRTLAARYLWADQNANPGIAAAPV
ncbi:HhH-GPD family protein [Deinococcus proteolyticus MRP]|uniref:DNA-3-methyladenine glycosylase II n=1 Tax=Deinococcus proteolyticus (strain ATCC 35074 / DSM 20540 / JCM 6276 / NBRC 101906 / NCIMB 13154 / VKM Ac-1939 / CCM 2703 / MRP) TaxID=693977 RepID=F0RMC3_DEIPM|nr:DNA-3-methyladenine glycosylase [Deinococcus proteolyticus]ADY27060.1 HhH-GPD family protein [Deinococcus proteolyticus MRP]